MKPNYNKLWHLMIDRGLTRRDLIVDIGFSSATVSKMAHNEWVSLEVIARVCRYLKCDIGDIVSIEYEEDNSNE